MYHNIMNAHKGKYFTILICFLAIGPLACGLFPDPVVEAPAPDSTATWTNRATFTSPPPSPTPVLAASKTPTLDINTPSPIPSDTPILIPSYTPTTSPTIDPLATLTATPTPVLATPTWTLFPSPTSTINPVPLIINLNGRWEGMRRFQAKCGDPCKFTSAEFVTWTITHIGSDVSVGVGLDGEITGLVVTLYGTEKYHMGGWTKLSYVLTLQPDGNTLKGFFWGEGRILTGCPNVGPKKLSCSLGHGSIELTRYRFNQDE